MRFSAGTLFVSLQFLTIRESATGMLLLVDGDCLANLINQLQTRVPIRNIKDIRYFTVLLYLYLYLYDFTFMTWQIYCIRAKNVILEVTTVTSCAPRPKLKRCVDFPLFFDLIQFLMTRAFLTFVPSG